MKDIGILNESQTRHNLIDPEIAKVGWNLADRTSVGFEIPVEGHNASHQNGITDYYLFRTNGETMNLNDLIHH